MPPPDDLTEFENLPNAKVWNFRHVYRGGYALMSVQKLRDGYEGALNIANLKLTRQMPPIAERADSLEECCQKLEQRFWENMPDHQCGTGCFRSWQPD
jgi:hypothetical protein